MSNRDSSAAADLPAAATTIDRRQLLSAGMLIAGTTMVSGVEAAECSASSTTRVQTSWGPEPPQSPAQEGVAQLADGAKLWYWDTGGKGESVVLLHPGTGSGAIWGYQQPVLSKAGYRVIGYSRRGHYRSSPASADSAATAAGDLLELLNHLRVARCHLVGSAAGGFVVPDFVLSHPDRVSTMTIACSLGGAQDPEFVRTTERILPPGFRQLPPEFRELSASYRAANPAGVKRWLELEHIARTGGPRRQPGINSLQWSDFARIETPALLLSGDADLYMPPSRLREFARHLPNSEHAVIAEAGHSAYWEQPDAFNATLLAFFAKHRAKA